MLRIACLESTDFFGVESYTKIIWIDNPNIE